MNKTIFFFLLVLSIGMWQCSSDANSATAESEATTETVEEPAAPPVQAQQPETVLSATEIFEKFGERYSTLHQTVSENLEAIKTQIDESTSPKKLKDGLKASFDEVAKYDNIEAICQTSKYTSAETVEQFMNGLEMYLSRWGVQ